MKPDRNSTKRTLCTLQYQTATFKATLILKPIKGLLYYLHDGTSKFQALHWHCTGIWVMYQDGAMGISPQ